jgi:hypothetical protein
MARHERTTSALALVACGVGVVVVLMALVLGFHFETTPRAVVDSAKAHRIAVPAVAALVLGAIALVGRRHGWALVVGALGAAAAVVAVLLTVLIPSG